MQFIENTRSRSSLIEYFRHFFIDTSIFEHQGGAALEAEGKAASSLPALQNGTPGCARRGRSKQRPYEGNPPRSQNEHGAPANGRGERRPYERRKADPSHRSPTAGDRVRDDKIFVLALFQVGGKRVAPDVVGEPVPVFLGYGALLLGLGDGMAEAFVENEFHGDAAVFESAIEFEGIGDGNARVFAALLNQRGRVRVVDISDGRSLAVDLRVAPRSGVQILARERRDVRVDVVSHSFEYSGDHRDSAEAVAECGDERGNVAALAPAHGADALRVNEALRDQIIDAGNHVGVIAHAEIADVERAEFR